MSDTCTVRRLTAGGMDEETGTSTPTLTVVYSGPCKMQTNSSVTSDRDAQAQQLTVQEPTLHLPFSAPVGATGDPSDVTTDDVATIDTSVNPALVGVKARISGIHPKTRPTAHRFPVEVSS